MPGPAGASSASTATPASSAATLDKLAVAAGCVTQGPESAEVIAWRKSMQHAVSGNLSAATSCFSKERQPIYLEVGLESRTPTSSNVWMNASTVSDCTLTRCVADKLRSTVLPPAPATLSSTALHSVSVSLTFDSTQTPALKVSATPDVPYRDSPCVDHSRLPKDGRLSAVHIQNQVREYASQQRKCYEQGLARNPDLAGRVEVRFVIALDGSVKTVEIKANSLPDCQVVGCVSDVFRSLRFDPPQGGTVTVVYPVVFDTAE